MMNARELAALRDCVLAAIRAEPSSQSDLMIALGMTSDYRLRQILAELVAAGLVAPAVCERHCTLRHDTYTQRLPYLTTIFSAVPPAPATKTKTRTRTRKRDSK